MEIPLAACLRLELGNMPNGNLLQCLAFFQDKGDLAPYSVCVCCSCINRPFTELKYFRLLKKSAVFNHRSNDPTPYLALGTRSDIKDLPAHQVFNMLVTAATTRGLTSSQASDYTLSPPSPFDPFFGFDEHPPPTPEEQNHGFVQSEVIPDTIGRDRQPTRLQRNPLLAQAVDNYRLRLGVDFESLRRRLPGADGSIEDEFTSGDFFQNVDDALKISLKALLNVITSNAAAYHIPQVATTDLLQNFIRLHEANVFTPGLTSSIPTDAKTAFKAIVGKHAPKLYKYQVCRACGLLRRCEARYDSSGAELQCCPCGTAWDTGSNAAWIRIFSIIDFLKKLFAAAPLAQAMGYAEDETRPRCDRTDPNAPMNDIFDTDFYHRSVEQHKVLSKDSRHAAISIFLDGMLKVATDQGSGTVTVCMLKLLNLPPHLRQMPGCTLSLAVIAPDVGKKSVQSVLDVFADEIAYLHENGEVVYDAHKKENFVLRGDLVNLAMDSKGITENAGRAEPNKLIGSSLGSDVHGYTMVDVTKEKNTQGQYARLGGKVFIPGPFPELPPKETNHRVRRLRKAGASINSRSTLTDGGEHDWSEDELPALRWSDETIRQGIACLEAAINAEPSQKATLLAAAHEVGVKVVTPWRKTGILMDTGVLYDPMHTITNALKRLREIQMGLGLVKSKKRRQHIITEREINKRYRSAADAIDANPNLDDKKLKELLQYPFLDEEIRIAFERGTSALRLKLGHRDIQGSKSMLAYRPKTEDKGLQFLKAADAHRLCGPLGKWLVAGLCSREFEVEELQFTYEEVYMEMLDALNELRRKVLTRKEAESMFKHALRKQLKR